MGGKYFEWSERERQKFFNGSKGAIFLVVKEGGAIFLPRRGPITKS